MNSREKESHGWWPYVVPYVSFLLMSELAARLPDAADPFVLLVKPAMTLGIILWFWKQGAYPELRNSKHEVRFAGGVQDILVGLSLTAVWVIPFIVFPSIRPGPGGEFNPAMAGDEFVVTLLFVRLFGYALVTPIFEELFIRSFVMRIADVWNTDDDFRDQPIARYTRRSMIVTIVVFSLGHVPWEWWVCVPWIVLSNLWFYHRRSVAALMLVHGVTNAALLALAVYGGDLIQNADGSAFSFWFFV
ncbi:MAG: CPBP family glutamic-type intramembrane protease, partial [Myxococcales bacterium]|nr:CPBP family intramembrane metalloprotease [Myxococcales bacterium]HIL81142.1 CPBP family intramembrane metalloprotease [Myxococcales bacterium]